MEWKYNDLIKWIENGCDNSVGESVTKLDISYNNLRTVPPEIGNLINVQYFSCDYNYLTILPPEIGNLINVQYFIVL